MRALHVCHRLMNQLQWARKRFHVQSRLATLNFSSSSSNTFVSLSGCSKCNAVTALPLLQQIISIAGALYTYDTVSMPDASRTLNREGFT